MSFWSCFLDLFLYFFVIKVTTKEVEIFFSEKPEEGIDPLCYRANGFFNHEDDKVCDKFYNCVYGKPHLLPCATSLIFDEAQGTCVRPEQASAYAKKCEINNEPGKRKTVAKSTLR